MVWGQDPVFGLFLNNSDDLSSTVIDDVNEEIFLSGLKYPRVMRS
ncbi:MAG: hypothetical protein Ct9H300mP6_16880 [Gammaproteobacteria bacterium]|nr:MAG: hypothetical protein Ct9H300mP6_16880 [Gammaproteobacteria bacterium]